MSRKFWTELFLLCLLFLVGNFIWSPSDPGFTLSRPHPYLILVLVIAARHGIGASLIACAFAISQLLALSQAGDHPLQTSSVFDRPWNFVVATWIVLGASVGAASDAKDRERDSLLEELEFLKKEFADTKKRTELFESENIELRRKVFGENETLNTVYAMARQLTTLTGQELFEASLELVERFVGATHSSIFLLDKQRLNFEQIHSRGSSPQRVPKSVPRGEPLFEKALKRDKPVTAKELFSAQRNKQEIPSLLVSRIGILDQSSSAECGVLVVHQIPLEKLNSETTGVFGLLTDWTTRSLNLVQRLEAAEDQNLELLSEIQRRRFTTAFIQTLSHVSSLELLALKVLCSDESSEIGYWNASRMLGIATESSNFSNRNGTLQALGLLLENGYRLSAIYASLPTKMETPGCTGLRLRIGERKMLNTEATIRVLKFYVSRFEARLIPILYTIEKKDTSPETRRRLTEELLEASELLRTHANALLVCLQIKAAEALKVTKADLILGLCFDSDPWTRRLAALASHELQLGIDSVALDALKHSNHELDLEVAHFLSAMPINS